MKTLRIGAVILGLLAAALTGSAWATPIPYFFGLDFISGPLNGQHIGGRITVDGNDCSGSLCTGTFDPNNVAKTLLGLDITVGGVPFAMTDDTGFGSGFPDVTFDALGHLIGIDFQAQKTFGGKSWVLDMTGLNIGDLAAFYQGTVGSVAPGTLVSVAVTRVPEPGTLPLLGVALIGAGLAWRRRASSGAARSAPLGGLAA